MDKSFEQLDDIFNVSGEIVQSEPKIDAIEPIEINTHSKEVDLQKDYNYTRGTIYSLVEKGQEAINGILELAQETESARAYEVAGQLIKSVSDATDKLMALHKNLKDIEEVKQSSPTNVTNALFIGSTAELSKLLKAQKKENLEDK